ncbi:MAG TPA: FG-GAP-like repeat-containing protein [Ktedonobacterales bacterium]|nr:FG-GAP-like repeat-containing protein [Ktedonobacterales bacterium]
MSGLSLPRQTVYAHAETSTTCPNGSILNIVAHEDDDILFLNPDVDQAIQQGECVRTLFLTAGDNNSGSAYAAQREAGAESAYAYMAGVADQWSAAPLAINGHTLAMYTLNGAPRISLVFFRLHEWADTGQTTLTALWNGTATGPITTLTGSDSYTRSDLITTLSGILTQTAPDTVNTQDPTAVYEPGVPSSLSSVTDHPDHIAGALFSQQAWELTSASMQLHQYRCDNIADSAADLYGSAVTRKSTIFDNYYLPYDSQANDYTDYSYWVGRRYLTHQYTHTVAGDFTADGKTDVLAFYRADDFQRTQARLLTGAGDGTFTSQTNVWDSGDNGWDWNRSVVLSGDFNGDGHQDALAIYAVPNDFGHTDAYLFAGQAQGGLAAPSLAWDSGVGNWDWGRAQYIAGDFNGDGITDVLAFYQYNEFGHTKAWLFAGSATGLQPPVMVWDSGVGNWDWSRATYLAGDFNGDGKTDVLAFYRYDEYAHVKAWLFPGTGASTAVQPPVMTWDSGVGGFDWTRAHFVAGDFNGDHVTDALAFYQYNEFGHTKALVFLGGPNGISPWTVAWDSGVGGFDWTHADYVTGDFNGDGVSDVQALYRYNEPAHTKLLFFAGTSGGLANWTTAWDSGTNNWDWSYALT